MRNIFISLAFSVFLAACSSAPKSKTTDQEKASWLIEAASTATNNGDPTQALNLLLEAEKFYPNNFTIHHLRSIAYYKKNELQLAIQSAQKAYALSPTNSDINNTLGKLYSESGKSKEALTYLNRAATDPLNPEAFKAYTTMGMIYYRNGNMNSSEKYFQHAVLQNQDSSCIAHYYLGHIYSKKQDFKKASHFYEKASTRLCEKFVPAHYAAGLTMIKLQKMDEAKKKFLYISKYFEDSDFSKKSVEYLKRLP